MHLVSLIACPVGNYSSLDKDMPIWTKELNFFHQVCRAPDLQKILWVIYDEPVSLLLQFVFKKKISALLTLGMLSTIVILRTNNTIEYLYVFYRK